MRVPAYSEASYQPERAVESRAPGVVPQRNAAGEQTKQFGQSLETAGQTVMRVDDVLQDRVDQARATEADAKLADAYRNALTAPDGFLNQKGRAAVDGRKAAIEQLGELRKSLSEAMTTQGQAERFAHTAEMRYQHAVGLIDSHYSKAVSDYEDAESVARAEALHADAVTFQLLPMQDPKAVGPMPAGAVRAEGQANTFLDGMLGELRRVAERKGMGPEQTNALLVKARDSVHTEVVSKMAESGRSLEAADYLKNTTVGPDTRRKLEDVLRVASVKEQGQAAARLFETVPGNLLDQIEAANKAHESGAISIEVRDETVQRLRAMDAERYEQDTKAGIAALAEAKDFATLNRAAPLPDALRKKLRAAGKEDAFTIWELQGGRFITTNEGFHRLQTLSAEELARFESAEAVESSFRTQLDDRRLETLILQWRQVRGEKLKEEDVVKLDAGLQEKRFLQRKGTLPFTFKDNDPLIAQRLDAFNEAVTREMNSPSTKETKAAQGGKLTALRDAAMTAVWEDGAVVDGNWLPYSMMSPSELKRVEFKGPTGTTYPLDTMEEQPFSTVAREADGTPVDLKAPGQFDEVPSFEQFGAELRRANRPDTLPNIIKSRAAFIADLEARKAKAAALADERSKAKRAALLTSIQEQHERELNRQLRVDEIRKQSGYTAASSEGAAFGTPARMEELRQQALDYVLQANSAAVATYGITPIDVARATGAGADPYSGFKTLEAWYKSNPDAEAALKAYAAKHREKIKQ